MLSFKLNCIALLCSLSFVCLCFGGMCVIFRVGTAWGFSVRGLLVVCICSCLLLFCLWQSTSTTASATTMETFLLSILSVLLSPLFPFKWLCVCVCALFYYVSVVVETFCSASAALAASFCRPRLHFACLTKAISNGFSSYKLNWCPGEWKLIPRHPKYTFTRRWVLRLALAGIWNVAQLLPRGCNSVESGNYVYGVWANWCGLNAVFCSHDSPGVLFNTISVCLSRFPRIFI